MENQQTSDTKESRINTQLLGIPKDEIRRIDVSEAEVVRRQYLSHIREPQVTIRPDGMNTMNKWDRLPRITEDEFVASYYTHRG